MPKTMHTQTLWVCSNCIMVLANGDDSGRSEGDPEPLSLPAGDDLSPGMVFSEHDESCEYAHGDSSADCFCESRDFSSSPCDGCGNLPGERHAVTVWFAGEQNV